MADGIQQIKEKDYRKAFYDNVEHILLVAEDDDKKAKNISAGLEKSKFRK